MQKHLQIFHMRITPNLALQVYMFFVAHKNGNIFSEGDSMVLGTLPESYMIICLWLGGDFPQLQLALSGVPIVAIQGGFECVCLKANLYQEKS